MCLECVVCCSELYFIVVKCYVIFSLFLVFLFWKLCVFYCMFPENDVNESNFPYRTITFGLKCSVYCCCICWSFTDSWPTWEMCRPFCFRQVCQQWKQSGFPSFCLSTVILALLRSRHHRGFVPPQEPSDVTVQAPSVSFEHQSCISCWKAFLPTFQ